jgi:heterodisulfide reductase subunit B
MCCPDPTGIQSIHKKTWLALAARNLAITEQKGFDAILTLCNGCFETLKIANHELQDEKILKTINDINKAVNGEYNGNVTVKHVHQVLYDEIGLKKLKEQVINPQDFKVATHTGCHLLRPHKILQIDDPDFPTELDTLVELTGVKSVPYRRKNACCGAGIRGLDEMSSYAITREKLTQMKGAGAQALVIECPTCFAQFDAGQRVIKTRYGEDYRLPVIYLPELLDIALGIDVGDELKLHSITPTPLDTPAVVHKS